MAKELGKELRKLRIDEGERLLEMAERLGISVPYLSAIETERKQPPVDFATKILKEYKPAPDVASRIRTLCARARDTFTISADTPLQRDTAAELALGFARLDNNQLLRIKQIMGSK